MDSSTRQTITSYQLLIPTISAVQKSRVNLSLHFCLDVNFGPYSCIRFFSFANIQTLFNNGIRALKYGICFKISNLYCKTK